MVALPASARDAKANVRLLRREGKVPAVVYGHGVPAQSVVCDRKLLHKAFMKAGESTLVELDIDGKKLPVLFKQVDTHVVSGDETHVDFYAVNLKEEIEAPVQVKLVGECPAVKELGGILVTPLLEVTVKSLPTDLPHELEASLASLVAFGDALTVKDLVLPKGVKVMDDPEAVIATIQEPRKEEEVVVAAPAEGAVPAEGAAPAAEGTAKEGDAAAKKEEKK